MDGARVVEVSIKRRGKGKIEKNAGHTVELITPLIWTKQGRATEDDMPKIE